MKLILSTALAVLFACGPASARCGPSEAVSAGLQSRWGEVAVETRTLIRRGYTFEAEYSMWVNPLTYSWTLTGTFEGVTCLLASGGGYAGQTIADFIQEDRV